ncbi:Hsp70 family protein [Dactylosporangium aurantiacum]|nr:Hsp70 family protein [Dactylosporangium aurantiacum]MDG6110176.1 Hsp70 family protein [Dactylosporangium aurantiacum]
MDSRGYRLGIDFGTSNTVAMLAWPDGHVRPLLFDGSPTLPSSVYADPQSGLLVGRDAVHAARVSPERFEPNPKRRIDEPTVLLGDREIPTVEVIAAVLARVNGEAQRVAGGPIGQTTITCPAAWAHTRRGVLTAAAERAGLGTVTLVPEPVAAAEVFRTLQGTAVRPGSAFIVYDLGAGTFDASVVRHGTGTFEVLAAEGLSTSGGLDIDAAIVGYIGAGQSPRDPAAWGRLVHPTTSAERRANRLLWDDVRAAKEMLSRASATTIHIPMYDEDIPLGRDQFEQLARPILSATVTATRAAVAAARLAPAEIAGVFLVGGGSRIPLVATLLHQALGIAPTAVEQPELVVAQGSLGAAAQPAAGPGGVRGTGMHSPPVPDAPVSSVPVSGMPVSSMPVSGPGFPTSAPPAPHPVSGSAPVPGSPPPAAPVSPGFSTSPVSGQPSAPAGYVAPPASPVTPGRASVPPAAPAARSMSPAAPGFTSGPGPTSAPPAAPGRASVSSAGHGAAAVPPSAPRPPATPPAPPSGGRRRTPVLAAVAVVLLLVVGLGVYGLTKLGDDSGGKSDQTSGQTDGSTDGSTDGQNGDGQNGDGGSPEPGTPYDAEHDNTDWSSTAEEYDDNAGKLVLYQCPKGGKAGKVWGSGPYTTASSVCSAAVHAGYLTLADGGRVIIQIRAGTDSYEAGKQYGIVTEAHGAAPWEFTIAG